MKIFFPISSIAIHNEREHKKRYSWIQKLAAKLFKLKLDGPYFEYQFKINLEANPVKVGNMITIETFGVPLKVITATKLYVIATSSHVMKKESARLLLMGKNGIIVYQPTPDGNFIRAKY